MRDRAVKSGQEVSLPPLTAGKIYRSHRHMSTAFLVVWLILVAYGLLMMFSASYGISFIQSSANLKADLAQTGGLTQDSPVREILAADATALARKQAGLTLLGTLLALGIGGLINFRQLTRPAYSWIVYGLVTISLFYCRLGGVSINGARRWVYLGPIRFQPSEIAKIGVVFFLAAYFARRKARMKGKPKASVSWSKRAFLDVTWPALLVLLWVGLVLIQPHLSGAIIIFLISGILFFMADLPLKSKLLGLTQLVLLVLVFSLVFGLGYPLVTKQSAVDFVGQRFAHVTRRLDTFQDRENASQDDRLQIEQAEIALGSGGLTGKGIGRSAQKLNFLSEAHNDFILPVIGEELGFIGVISVILLFLAFLVTGILVAKNASNQMAMLLAAGNTLLIVIQAFLNMAVAVSLIPTTGISLPFFSYGGTASIFFALSAGLILCVSKSAVRTDPRLARIVHKGKSKAGRGKESQKQLEEEDSMRYAV